MSTDPISTGPQACEAKPEGVAAERPVAQSTGSVLLSKFASSPEPSSKAAKPRFKIQSWLIALGLLAVIGSGVGITLHGFGKRDFVSDSQNRVLTEQLQTAALPLANVDLRDPKQKAAAMAGLDLSDEEGKHVVADAEAGRVLLAMIRVWDNQDEDGDAIELAVGGLKRTVYLWNEPVTVVIPYRPGELLTITGQRDGSGGITLSIAGSNGKEIQFPAFKPGTSFVLPLR